jgi:hypothetical protein
MDRTPAGAVFRSLRVVIQLVVCLCFFAHVSRTFAAGSASKAVPCGFADPTLSDTSDIAGVSDYKAAIRQLLATQKFQELDCIADVARASKSQFAGGRWKLNVLYWAIEEPQGHATEEDWASHLNALRRWVSVRPKSITARVALANAYTAYAWNARGSDYAGTVTQSGWKLLHERVAKARTILEEASRLKNKCPHWYVVMQRVALAEGWDLSRETTLLAQAVAFEPGYHYYYRNHANYLKPQWNGEEGDAERYAVQVADHVGGAKGDILYFQIATELICHCSAEPDLKLMSWPRIQAGVAQLEKQNGMSRFNLNLLAYMAIKRSDSVVARNAFLRIGDDWAQEIWKTRKYFDSSKEWATKRAEYEDLPSTRIIRQAREKFAPAIQQCAQSGAGDMTSFHLQLSVQKEGTIDSVRSFPQTAIGSCLTKLNGETLSPPPYVPFMFNIEVDPAELLRSSH